MGEDELSSLPREVRLAVGWSLARSFKKEKAE